MEDIKKTEGKNEDKTKNEEDICFNNNLEKSNKSSSIEQYSNE